MADLKRTLEALERRGWLKVIDTPLDVALEIPHIAYIEVKRPDAKVLLFTRPVDRKRGIEYAMPVVMNMFASREVTEFLFSRAPDEIAREIETLLHLKPPQDLRGKLSLAARLFGLKSVPPKRLRGEGACQKVRWLGEEADLERLPILTTWPEDGGPFITMGQVYTQSLDGTLHNLGMYRLQRYGKRRLGMHWQIHKDSSHFFDQYRDAGKKMPVSIAIGGDPLYIWCAQAPMPYGMFELLLYGFVRKTNARLVKSLTNDLYIPEDVDIVIEGEVDPRNMEIEGPFGDHTGYYTLPEPYPVMEVTAITTKEEPIYQATVVGKPPLEDKYMGWGTERIFLPLLQTTAPDLIDYHMPENGVFHNLILAKIAPHYKGHAKQIMHAFWGVGQMSFVKHALFVAEDAPPLEEYEALTRHILDRIDAKDLLITEGIVDALDHSAPEALVGGKLGVDATGKVRERTCEVLEDSELLRRMQSLDSSIVALKQYMTDTANPITVVQYEKSAPARTLHEKIAQELPAHLRIVVYVDTRRNSVENPYMLIWRVVNNIDAKRDIYLGDTLIGIDGTNKDPIDGFVREWPADTHCDPDVIADLRRRGLIDVDDAFLERYQILP